MVDFLCLELFFGEGKRVSFRYLLRKSVNTSNNLRLVRCIRHVLIIRAKLKYCKHRNKFETAISLLHNFQIR